MRCWPPLDTSDVANVPLSFARIAHRGVNCLVPIPTLPRLFLLTQAIPLSPARPARAYLALVMGMLCISFTAIFTKWANVPGPVSAAWRMTIAAVVLALPFFQQARRWTPAAWSNLSWGIAGGLSFALNLGLLNTALLLTSAATATLLDNTAPIWVLSLIHI